MQSEVHTGARPGRPLLTLVLCAVLLAGALGLAWWQAGKTRALGHEQPVGDTPLRVRPPKRWIVDPQDPQAFILPVREESRQRIFRFERRIRFEYERLPVFRSPEQLLRDRGLDDRATMQSLRHVRIGPYDAIEVTRFIAQRIGQSSLLRERLLRLTCLPRGHVIVVEYDPLIDLRPADEQILDDVCSTLRVEEPTLSGSPEAYLRDAGLSFPLEEGWRVVGTDMPEVAGVYVGGSIDGRPAWAIGILRTWRSAGRAGPELLTDLAAESWLAWDAQDRIRQTNGADGAVISSLRCTGFGQMEEAMPSAWVVDRSPSRIAIVYVFAGPRFATAADEIAGRIAASLEILPLETSFSIEEAESAGHSLVAKLQQRGAVPAWGRGRVEIRYRGRAPRGLVDIIATREALGQNAEAGYKGVILTRTENTLDRMKTQEQIRWVLGGQATAYSWRADLFGGLRQINVRESRSFPTAEVIREIQIERLPERRWQFEPGPAFIPPPAETIAEGWVARGTPPVAIVEASPSLGPATCTVLLRSLPPEGETARVLHQRDYWPAGIVLAFAVGEAEPIYQRSASAYLERVGLTSEP